MADKTKIEWADATVNAVNGCSVLSPGCTNCYAMKLAGTRLRHHPSRAGLTNQTKAGPVWNGKVSLNEGHLLQPLRWEAPRRIFWNAHGDLFHESVPDEWIEEVLGVCAMTPQHQHLILTKRSARMRDFMTLFSEGGHYVDKRLFERHCALPQGGYDTRASGTPFADRARAAVFRMRGSPVKPWVLPNVWLGVSVEDQQRADGRIPDLLQTPAAIRFISAEPLLGPVDLAKAVCGKTWSEWVSPSRIDGLDWVIAGGESGPGARPMHPDWARSLRDQCAAASVPFFFKQWGEWVGVPRHKMMAPYAEERLFDDGTPAFRIGKKRAGHLLDGIEHHAFPSSPLGEP